MAEDAAVTSSFGFLGQKLGPLPVGVYLVVLVGLVWYFRKHQAASASSAPNQQTDPAGNVGTIDPSTGYVSGSPEDQAALASNNSGSSSSTGGTSAGTGATSGAQAYADNNAWGIAAVNYLVGLGIDATTANQAIQQYLASQNLTTAQQADVNLAIRSLGPPPSLPGPTSSNPPPVTTPGGTKPPGKKPPGKKSVPAPTGLVITSKHSHTATAKWNKVTGATGYRVRCTDMATKRVTTHDNVVTTLTANLDGLTPSHSYVVDVWAQPEAANGAHAEVSFTTPRTG